MGTLGRDFQRIFAARMAQIGTTATITRLLTAAYNPATSEATPDSSEIEVKGFFDKAKHGVPGSPTDLQIGERVFCTATLDATGNEIEFAPEVGYSVTIGARTYSARYVESEYADDVQVYHRLYLSQA
jgi:hypothetical protein